MEVELRVAALVIISDLAREYTEEWYAYLGADKQKYPWAYLCAEALLELYENYISTLHSTKWLPDIDEIQKSVELVVKEHRDAWHVADVQRRFETFIEDAE